VQTLKTAIVVVLLLVVFYGVYEMLNSPPGQEPPEVAGLTPNATAELDIDLGDFPAETLSAAPSPPSAARAPGASSGDLTISITGPPAPASRYGSSSTADVPEPPVGASLPPVAPPLPQPDTMVNVTPAPSPSQVSVPTADSSVMAVPGSPQMQHNPFINDEPVPKPTPPQADQQQIGVRSYQRAMKMAQSLIADGDYHAALSTLSVFYKSQDLSDEEHRELLDLLDPLAGRVIYSREHLLEPPYTVRRNETLMDIAGNYSIPFKLLQKINGIENPNVLLPGSQLKVVTGPFRAEVDLEAHELTVFLGRLYAGRFPITLGTDPKPVEGDFHVRDKQLNKAYFSMDGRTVPGDSPANPFGGVWLDLGREVCIHGSPLGGVDTQRGCVSLSPRDADDVYSILSVGSKVRILR
jgi:LysM repeat protein